jgi:hypothetical protein
LFFRSSRFVKLLILYDISVFSEILNILQHPEVLGNEMNWLTFKVWGTKQSYFQYYSFIFAIYYNSVINFYIYCNKYRNLHVTKSKLLILFSNFDGIELSNNFYFTYFDCVLLLCRMSSTSLRPKYRDIFIKKIQYIYRCEFHC